MKKNKFYATDCFAYRETKDKKFKCSALAVSNCANCEFYQNKDYFLKRGGDINACM